MPPVVAENRTTQRIRCDTCAASCCRLQVILFDDHRVPVALTGWSDWGGMVMRRGDDGWCLALDRRTLRCTIYPVRPSVCREYRMGGADCRQEWHSRTTYPEGRTI